MPVNTKLILPVAAALLLSTGLARAETAAPAPVAAPVAAPAPADAAPAAAGEPVVTRRPMLENMDRDQDGFVDAREVETFATEQFEQIDNNKDGVITAEEMNIFHHARRGKWEKQRDPSKADVPGVTSAPESRMKAKAEARRKDHFSRVDPDGDGKVTKDEFVSHAIARHKKTDADGDSKVTKDEIRKQHDERKEKLKERREKIEQRKSEGKMSKPPAADAVKDDAKAATPAE